MAKKTSEIAGGGSPFFTLLAILFIALKLTGQIEWSWLWVLSPIWIPLALVLVVLALGAVIYFLRKVK